MPQHLTPLAVAALALLREGDMHPYEMYKLLIQRRHDTIVAVKPGSLYHTVDRLAAAGYVAPIATESEGHRPERTIYRLTGEGRAALRECVAMRLRGPVTEHTWFPVAIAEAHNLTKEEVIAQLGARLGDLGTHCRELEDFITSMQHAGIERRYWLTATYLLAMTRAEIGWVEQTRADIDSTVIDWQPPPGGDD